ncbi:MAG: hypothetical protein WD229_07305 [Pirellulales bacterium]
MAILLTASSFVLAVAITSADAVQLEFDTELTSLNLTTPAPVAMPLASDPGNALGDSVMGYGFVDSQVTVTLSSQRLINPGPQSLGQACATDTGGPGTAGCMPSGSPPPIDPNDHHGQQFFVDSFFDVFFDITVTDVDPRPGRDYAGQGPGASIMLQDLSDAGNKDMQTSYSIVFDKDAPNFGLLPPPETFPYIGHFNIEIPLGGDLNGNGENDKIKFTLAAHQVNGENRTFIILPNGTVIDSFDSTADLSGAVVDVSADPPFSIHMIGPTTAESTLLNPVVPEPSALMLLAAGWLVVPLRYRNRLSS